jgi:outer membrane protein OmpA-like peptidoglycan-associated protein
MPNLKNFLVFFLLIKIFIGQNLHAQGQTNFAGGISDFNITGFAISPEGDYMVLSVQTEVRSYLCESFLQNDVWTFPAPIDIINNFKSSTSNIGGPSFNFNASSLYFHADYPGGIGGYDIYYSVRSSKGWSEPINAGYPLNSMGDDTHPSINASGQKFYLSRENKDETVKKPRRTPDCQKLFFAGKDISGKWTAPVLMHDVINKSCAYGLHAANDGKTVFFSLVDQDNHKAGYNIYFARELMEGTWQLPSLVESIASDESNLNPRIVGDYIYYLRHSEGRRSVNANIFKEKLPEQFVPFPTLSTKGKILNLEGDQPIKTELKVFNPTTLKVLGTFQSDKETGEFEILLPDNDNYIVDVRTKGYSFASFQLDYREEEKLYGPEMIKLFDKAELIISVYDKEIFRPLDANVWVEFLIDEKQWLKKQMTEETDSADIIEFDDSLVEKIYATRVEPGVYSLIIPLGREYIVNAKAAGFKEDAFRFNLKGDIIFSQFSRNMSLEPIKRAIDFYISDADTRMGVSAEILITNLNREETIFFTIQDVKDGKITAMLREGDQYEFTVKGAQGYSFHNQTFNLGDELYTEMAVDLVPLKTETSIRLNNIYFATNSADLTSESFPELDRVVELINTNPQIKIEISAHTDNVGSDKYNLLLSDRRAKTVLNYLLENNVLASQLVSKGYGMKKPLVPNDSDDNRAMNRRVEFKILDVRQVDNK